MKLSQRAIIWDGKYNFPRPANEQHLDSYLAFLRLAKDYLLSAMSVCFTLVSLGLLFYSLYYAVSTFNLAYLSGLGALGLIVTLLLGLCAVMCCVGDITGIFLPYRREFQRQSHGGRYWARAGDLKDRSVLVEKGKKKEKGVIIAPFKRSFFSFSESLFDVFLPLKKLFRSIAFTAH